MFHTSSSLYDFAAAALMIFVGLLIFYYVSKHMQRESACENCGTCSYNGENFSRREITSNDLSKISQGMSV